MDIISVKGKDYIKMSDVPAYERKRRGEPFDIPSYRTLRHYCTIGKIKPPKRLGKKVYYEIKYITKALDGITRKYKQAQEERAKERAEKVLQGFSYKIIKGK